MKFIRFCLLVFLLATLSTLTQPDSIQEKPHSQSTGKTTGLILSDHETAWLAAHRVIRVGKDPDYAPYEWTDKGGRHVGMAVDFLRLLAEKLGGALRDRPG